MRFNRHNIWFGVQTVLKKIFVPGFINALVANVFDFSYRFAPPITKVELEFCNSILLNFESKAGNTSVAEQCHLVSLCQNRKRIFEIGTFDGQTSYTLARNLPNAQIFTLDIPSDVDSAMSISTGERTYS